MERVLKLEEAALFGFSVYLFSQTSFAWWWFPVLLLAPDLSMLGYIFGTRPGAMAYNFFHHKALALIILVAGWYSSVDWMTLSGIILLAHSAMDRVAGYGLKFSDHFGHTHLGWIGPRKQRTGE